MWRPRRDDKVSTRAVCVYYIQPQCLSRKPWHSPCKGDHMRTPVHSFSRLTLMVKRLNYASSRETNVSRLAHHITFTQSLSDGRRNASSQIWGRYSGPQTASIVDYHTEMGLSVPLCFLQENRFHWVRVRARCQRRLDLLQNEQ